MYCGNKKQIEEEKALIIDKLSELGLTDVHCYILSVGANKAFTVRAETMPWCRSSLFGDCSYECRKTNDHDADLCALNSLLTKAKDLESLTMMPVREWVKTNENR